ncbi:hypothetical protein [Pseudomonas sp. GM74]|uniref:hypothetical protein n=1 Tax=Pseudomonas sp. GM74 TaxID=1144336 RepID=UPI0012FC0167|nr:hypothetical protein [Pseudomonas sp. GM74]
MNLILVCDFAWAFFDGYGFLILQGFSMSNSSFSFVATVEIFGRPVKCFPEGRIGTEWNYGDSTIFNVHCENDEFILSVGQGEDKRYVALDTQGYLTLRSTHASLLIKDAGGKSMSSEIVAQGKASVKLYATNGAPVLQFYGDDLFDVDDEALYNFLIAAQKVRKEGKDGSVSYYVPSGDGAWLKVSRDKSYSAIPVPIELNIQSVVVTGS